MLSKAIHSLNSRTLTEKVLCGLFVIVFVLQLLPLLLIAPYDAPCADDFGYSYAARHALRSGGNLGDVLRIACETVSDTYVTWQGTYSGLFLMVLQPAIWGEAWYALTPILILTSLIGSVLFLCRALFKGWFRATNAEWLMIGLGWLTLFLQFIPSPVQGIYWYNGAMYYVLFFSFTLTLAGCALTLVKTQSKRGVAVRIVLGCVLAAVIGGGNYVTALMSALLLFLATLWLGFRKDSRWRRLLPILLVLAAGFAVSALAPGNALRQNRVFPEHSTAPQAVLDSLACVMEYAGQWLTAPVLLLYAFLCPVLFSVAKRAPFSFRHPWLAPILGSGLAAAAFCPPLYALGGLGGFERVTNVIYAYFLFVPLFTLFCFCGYLSKKLPVKAERSGMPVYSLRQYALLTMLFVFSCGVLYLSNFSKFMPTSLSAALSLLDGSAKQYRAEYDARLTVLNDISIQRVVLEPFSVKPRVLYFDDGKEDDMYFQNRDMRNYFQKESIVVREP